MNQLNKKIRWERSPTLAMSEQCEQMIQEGRDVIRLGFGFSPFPVPPSLIEGLQHYAHRREYQTVQGLLELREAVCEYNHRFLELPSDPQQVVIGPGSKQLMFLLQLVYQARLVLPSPSWVSYEPQAKMIGLTVDWLPTSFETRWKMTPSQLEAYFDQAPEGPKLLILNYPTNPSGQTYDLDELKAIAQIVRKNGALVLSDEIYAGTHFENKHFTIAGFYPEGTIISSGLSKWCGAGGWRLGTFTFPKALDWLCKAVVVAASETHSSVASPIQCASVRAFRGSPEIERYLFQCRRILKTLAFWVADTLSEAGIRTHRSEGAFYVMPDFSAFEEAAHKKGIQKSIDFFSRLLQETGVAVLPASYFGRPEEEFTARLAYIDFDGEKALAQAALLADQQELGEKFIEQCCPKVKQGVQKIIAWADQLKR